VYAVVIAFVTSWYIHMGEGPMWNTLIGTEVEDCRRHWWINLLYFNNYFELEEMVSFSLPAIAENIWRVTDVSSNHSCLPIKLLIIK
jgi:hypothetical protein